METISSEIINDIKNTGEMLYNYNSYNRFTTYDRVYFETNEQCDKIISNFNVKDKTVLTVLASGDQAFQFYKHGAKNVDLFDVNKLTIYYYYLRIWHIRKNGKMYLKWCPKKGYIKNLLSSVNPKTHDELKAYEYWSLFIDKFDSNAFQRFFNSPYNKGTYKKIDTSLLLDKIDDDDFTFYNIDISNFFDLEKKYDYIYTSNLSDYIKDDKLTIYRDNLYNHLNKGGVVLSSNLSGSIYCYQYSNQRKIMERYFKFKCITDWNEELLDSDDIGYSYKKRRIKRII